VDRWRRRVDLAVVPVGSVLTIVVAVTILHVSVAVVGAASPVAVASVVVAIAAVILAGRVITTATARRRIAPTTRGAFSTGRAGIPAGPGIKPPGSGGWSAGPLDFQQIIASDTFVVHLVIRIIRIPTALVFDECKESARCRAWGRNIATNKSPISLEFVR